MQYSILSALALLHDKNFIGISNWLKKGVEMNSLVDKYIGGYDNTEKRKQTVKIYKNGNEYNRIVG